jgi:N-succinyldiaminopimelate aminotransferase
MTRKLSFSKSVAAIPGAVYSAFARRLASHSGEVYPLHVGDTWMEPAAGCRMEDLNISENPGMHRYAPPQGIPELLEAIASKTQTRTGIATSPDNVLVAAGATGALGAVIGAVMEPGDEFLILAPYWPLIEGIVRSFHGVPIAVPFMHAELAPGDIAAALEPYTSDRTVGIYFNTPNNPSGKLIDSAGISSIVNWAVERGYWVISDEVYEDYVYEGVHTPARPLAPDQVFSLHSFSKAYGMAGNRCGYVIGPIDAIAQVRKVSTHTFYSTPTASQLAGLRALQGAADDWVRAARSQYSETGHRVAATLGVDPPHGSTFLFMDVEDALDETGLDGLLGDCADRGLLVAPGPSFGPYPHHVRICFTCAPPDVVLRGVELFAEILEHRRTVQASLI